MRIRIFTPATRAAVRRAPDARHGVRARRPAPEDRDPARDGRGRRPGRARARGRRDPLRLDGAAAADVASRSRARTSCWPRSASSAPGCPSSSTTTARPRLRRARLAGGRSRRSRPTSPRSSASTDAGVNCFARDGGGWKTRMFAPGHGVPEDPATGSAAGPLAVHLARHGRIALRRGDRDLAGRRDRPAVDALRAASTAAPSDRARPRRRLGRRRRPRRVQYSLSSERLDLGQLAASAVQNTPPLRET